MQLLRLLTFPADEERTAYKRYNFSRMLHLTYMIIYPTCECDTRVNVTARTNWTLERPQKQSGPEKDAQTGSSGRRRENAPPPQRERGEACGAYRNGNDLSHKNYLALAATSLALEY